MFKTYVTTWEIKYIYTGILKNTPNVTVFFKHEYGIIVYMLLCIFLSLSYSTIDIFPSQYIHI